MGGTGEERASKRRTRCWR